MPVARESVPVIGPDSIMSSALPAGAPSKMSVKTTSATSLSTIRCAVVEPTNPPPTTVTFFRIPSLSLSNPALLPRDGLPRHILDNCRSKCRGSHFGRAGHQPFQVVGHSFLLNRTRNAILDEFRGFSPSQKFKH